MNKEEKVQLGLAVGSVAAFMLGMRRLAGAIVLYDGYRAYQNHHKPHAIFSASVGGAFLLWPDWPEGVRNAIGMSPAPTNSKALPAPTPVANPVSLTQKGAGGDELFLGNWTLFDVSETQSPQTAAAAKTLQPGQGVALVLGKPGAPPLVFKVKVIPGGQGGRYIGQWITEPPAAGPQFAEFGPNHVLAVT